MAWTPLKEALASLFPAGQPDHGDHDRPAINAQHDKGGHLHRPRRHVEREFGEPERADNRNQKYQPHRKHNRK